MRRWFAQVAGWLGVTAAGAILCASASSFDAHAQGKKRPTSPPRSNPTATSPAPAKPHAIVRTRPYASCPSEMVSVGRRFCIDRYEASTVDADSGRPLSPFYPPHPRLAKLMHERWTTQQQAETAGVADGGVTDGSRTGPVMPLPALPAWQKNRKFRPKAISKPNVIPQGYTPGFVAVQACRNAEKRLCREDEWILACRGARNHKFPYGNSYRQGACNVFREAHPGHVLHGDWSTGLSDPRLNLVTYDGLRLLRVSGGSPMCGSGWGRDKIYDMMGNLDEWVDDPKGLFLGGFYARNTRKGCEARVGSHPTKYFDYSTGFRCCADLAGKDQKQ